MKADEYATADAASKSALVEWVFESHVCSETHVVPDGCNDFILKENSEPSATWFNSDVNDSSYKDARYQASARSYYSTRPVNIVVERIFEAGYG